MDIDPAQGRLHYLHRLAACQLIVRAIWGPAVPRIGLLSDSHGRATTTRKAVEVLLDQRIDVLLHLGDVGSVEVIDALGSASLCNRVPPQAHIVFGNTDWDRDTLAEYAQEVDVTVDDPVGSIDLGGGTMLLFCHGHEADRMSEALARHPRYLCHGHTHRKLDTRRNGTRIINPGALFRAATYSVAVLDTQTDTLSFHDVPDA